MAWAGEELRWQGCGLNVKGDDYRMEFVVLTATL